MTTPLHEQRDVVTSVHHSPLSVRAAQCDPDFKNGGSCHNGSFFRHPQKLLVYMQASTVHSDGDCCWGRPGEEPVPFLEVPPTSRHHHPCHQLSLSLRTQLEWLFSCQPVFPSPDIHLKSQAKQPAVADRLSQILVPLAKFRYVWPWFSRGFCISFPETLRPVSVMRISLLGSYESLPWSGLHSVAGTL